MTNEPDFLDFILTKPKPQIRVEFFKQIYLPLIFDPDPSVFNVRWINEVSMNPYLEVDAVNDNNEVEFTIPALRKSVNTTTDQSICLFANYAKQEASIHIIKAQALMNQNLPKLIRFADARHESIQQAWADLLIKLGYQDRLVNSDIVSKSSSSDSSIVVEDEDWD